MGSLNTICSVIAVVVSLVGCGQLLPSADKQTIQSPTTPQTVELRITVDGTGKINVGGAGSIDVKGSGVAADKRCECGCGKHGCDCVACTTQQPSGSNRLRALNLTRPIVVMLTDYAPGQCGACDAAWRDWQRDGATWPFELRKESPNRLGDTSPTFEWADRNGKRRPWRPTSWTDASELIRTFTASQK